MFDEYLEKLNSMQEDYLVEMALSRGEAIDICMSLGKQFTNHFNKVCDEGKNSSNFKHHCEEMQSWFDKVKSIKLRHTRRLIQPTNLYDWFFTCGAELEDVVNLCYIDDYEYLVNQLLCTSSKVFDVLKEIL